VRHIRGTSDAVAAPQLGLVDREIGRMDERGRSRRIAGEAGDSQAHRHVNAKRPCRDGDRPAGHRLADLEEILYRRGSS